MIRPSCSLALMVVITSFGGVLTRFAQATPNVKPVATANSSTPKGDEESAPTKLQSLIKALSGKWLLSVRFEPTGGMPSALSGTGESAKLERKIRGRAIMTN
jgi:hypothetical protein